MDVVTGSGVLVDTDLTLIMLNEIGTRKLAPVKSSVALMRT
jgi:hypothetical protein